MNNLRLIQASFVLSIFAAPCLAQSGVNANNKFSWSENCGWMNWRDAGNPQASQGFKISATGTFASGLIWAENIGYINVGDGTPVNGLSYSNSTGADFGVNIDSFTGNLSGLAWGENVGWLNFAGGAFATPANPARLDASAGRLRGFVWGENIGWINLDHASTFVSVACPADMDNGTGAGTPDGGVDVSDLIYFLTAFEAGTAPADLDDGSYTGTPDGGVDINDLLYFLVRFESGC